MTSDEFYPFFFADSLTMGSRSGLPAQTLYLLSSRTLDNSIGQRIDLEWCDSTGGGVSFAVQKFQWYSWRLMSSLVPVEIYTHDEPYSACLDSGRRQIIQNVSTWMSSVGTRQMFIQDAADYAFARNRSRLTQASYNGSQVSYTFTGSATDPDGRLISTQVLVFPGDTEGQWQSVAGFTSGLTASLAPPPPPPPPAPVTLSLNPSAAATGGPAFTLTVIGGNFVTGSVVRWNGSNRTTTFVSPSQLTAAIPASDIVAAGTAQVTVFSPAPGGGTSNAQTFTISNPNPVPATTSISPSSAAVGGAAFTLTVNGSNFVPASVVNWNGSARTTTFASSTRLTAAIPASDIVTVGTAQVTVFNPTPGGGTSNAQTITISTIVTFDNPVPPGSSGSLLNGIFQGIDFGTGQWRWETAFGPDPTNHIYFDSSTGTSRTFTFSPAPRLLNSVTVFTGVAGTLTLSDNLGQTRTQAVATGSLLVVNTGWTQASTTVTVNFTAGWNMGLDDINYIASGPNPVPSITTVSPSPALVGSGFTLTVNGSNFVSGSVVNWNGSARTTTFVSSTQLTAVIAASDVASTGSAAITVFNPAPGGGTSSSVSLSIVNPLPTTSSLSPTGAVIGGPAFTLTVNGSNFVSGSVANWNGSARTTTFVNSTQLTVAIPASDIAAAGTAPVTVVNPTPGGGASNAQNFTISNPNPVPATTSLSPTSTTAGGAGFTLTVNGSNFINGSVVNWNSSARTTTFVNSTQLTATIPASDIATGATPQVTVFNPAPGGGTSNSQTFTINNPVPATTSLSPTSTTAGGAGFTLTVNGSNFVPGSVVRWNGANRTTTFVSGSQLTAAIPVTDIATAGTAQVTVFNPAPTGGTSNPQTFTISSSGGSGNTFVDGFNRPDSPTLGNGWTMKYPPGFAISGGEVIDFNTAPIDYHDAINYRPTSEDQRDVEVGAQFRILPGMNFPQVHARIQRNTITQTDTLEDYLFFVDGFQPSPGRAIIARQQPVTGQFECYMLAIPFPSPLQTTDRYRMGFQVVGGGPVTLTGIVERFDGTGWQIFASGSIVHDTNTQRDPSLYCDPGFLPPPLTTAGAEGFAKWTTNNEVYDNFTWTSLSGPSNPLPTTNISPTSATAGGAAFTLTVNGTNFVAGSLVYWNGASRATTFVSATQLTAAIPASDIAGVAAVPVTVVNPAPGGGTSNAQTFNVNPSTNPVPATTSISPSSAAVGGAAFTLTVNGSNFVPASVVNWNGSARTTTFVSSTRLTAAIPASDIVTVGTAQVTVFNPAPGGGTSNPQTFTISNSPPTVVTFDNPVPPGSPGSLLSGIFQGIDFGTGQWRWETAYGPDPTNSIYFDSGTGTSRTFTFSPAPRLLNSVTVFTGVAGTLTLSDNLGQTRTQAVATGSLLVVNTGWTQASTTVTVNFTTGWNMGLDDINYIASGPNPVPSITTVSPSPALVGSGFTLTVNGSNFVSGSAVNWNGSARTTTFVSSTQLTAVIPASDVTATGSAAITVFNPAPGGGTSNSVTLPIANPLPTTSSLSPTGAAVGGPAFTLTVNGTNFVAGSVVNWNGSARTTTFVNSTQLTAAIPASDIAAAGTAQVTVVNPTPGGGTSNAQNFTISNPNPVPATTSLSPTSTTAGGAGFTLAVNGSNFINGSVVNWNSSARTTTFVNSTQLTAAIPASDIATGATPQVTVFNPAPGGGTSNSQTFTINNPVPATTSLSPTSTTAGGAAFTLTVNGSNFVPASVVRWNGANRTTTFVSGSQLTAAIPGTDIATAGTAQVTVFNPTPGGGTSNPQTFTISNSPTVVTFDNPVPPGSSGSLLSGIFQGIDFGTGQWRWETASGPDPTNHIYFDSSTGTSRTFTFSPGPRRLTSISVFALVAGTLTLTDNLGQTITLTVPTGSLLLLNTGWSQASTTITVQFTAGWNLGLDDITYN